MHYPTELYNCLKDLYTDKGQAQHFLDDNSYLKSAFVETELLWQQNYCQLSRIQFIVIGEAPLWGDNKNYIYNPARHNTQFFTRNDLAREIGVSINNKTEFIEQCIQLGLIFIDIFPFALNKKITKLNFQKMSKYDYISPVRKHC